MAAKVIPAQLAFLAIYNPQLGSTDETFRDQLVFYHSKSPTPPRRDHADHADSDHELRDDENEKLRHIGLAQGMVAFARSFSDGESVDHVDTEKSRIVMHELERGWWLLASIDLTRLPASPSLSKSAADSPAPPPSVEYSAREVAPPELLRQQLLRAHNIFCLHHGPSLSDLYVRLTREKFCNILDRFWTRFANDWDVLLHGSPATDVYSGIKLAAGGELGMGVGEEEWGSGEREVFEDFATRTEGLVDMVISRFGEPVEGLHKGTAAKPKKDTQDAIMEPWMGTGRDAEAADGVIFSGIGAVSRSSLRDISTWMQWIYTYGEYAYGIKENPNSDRRKRRRRNRMSRANNSLDGSKRAASQNAPRRVPLKTTNSLPPGIPRPIVTAVEQSLDQASTAADTSHGNEQNNSSEAEGDTWMKYLTLGYGSAWGGQRPKSQQQSTRKHHGQDAEKIGHAPMQQADAQPDADPVEEAIKAQVRREINGHFIIGHQGDLDEETQGDSEVTVRDMDGSGGGAWDNRTLLRTLHVKVKKRQEQGRVDVSSEETVTASAPGYPTYERLRVIVYVHRPFITTLLFGPRTDSLSYPAFYRHLHTYLAPLHKPLTLSTSPARVAVRVAASSQPYTTSATNAGPNTQPIYDIVYDPLHMTIHSSVPNIPDPGSAGAEGLGSCSGTGGWTRIEALNVHSQILATITSARDAPNDIERTAKTGRGWWLVWMRLPPSEPLPPTPPTWYSPTTLPASSRNLTTAKTSASSLRSLSSAEDVADAQQPDPPPPPADASSPAADPARADSPSGRPQTLPTASLREAILVRRSRDGAPAAARNGRSGAASGSIGSSSLWRLGLGGGGGGGASSAAATGGAAAGWGPRGLVEGVGIDARRYVEGLLSLNR